jgi:hypothetical protein
MLCSRCRENLARSGQILHGYGRLREGLDSEESNPRSESLQEAATTLPGMHLGTFVSPQLAPPFEWTSAMALLYSSRRDRHGPNHSVVISGSSQSNRDRRNGRLRGSGKPRLRQGGRVFATDLSDYVTGAVIPIDGGLVRG